MVLEWIVGDGRTKFVDDGRWMSGCRDAMLVIDSDEMHGQCL
jgi:hypothetical protein